MRKSEIIAALEKLHGDPEIEIQPVDVMVTHGGSGFTFNTTLRFLIDRINEYPRPEIVVIEK